MRSVCSASCRVCAPLRSAGATAWYDGRAAPAASYRSARSRTAFTDSVAFSRNSIPSASPSARHRARRASISRSRASSPSRIVGAKSAVKLKTTPFSPNAVPAARRAAISSSVCRSGICFTVRRNARRSPSINAGVSAFSISSSPMRARAMSPVPSATNRSSSGFQSTSRRNFACSLSNVLSKSDLIRLVIAASLFKFMFNAETQRRKGRRVSAHSAPLR